MLRWPRYCVDISQHAVICRRRWDISVLPSVVTKGKDKVKVYASRFGTKDVGQNQLVGRR